MLHVLVLVKRLQKPHKLNFDLQKFANLLNDTVISISNVSRSLTYTPTGFRSQHATSPLSLLELNRRRTIPRKQKVESGFSKIQLLRILFDFVDNDKRNIYY